MTKEQEIIAEKIIQLHKDKEGSLDADQLHNLIKFDNSRDSILINKALIEKGIIEYMGNQKYRTRLTEFGWEFSGFEVEKIKISNSTAKDEKIKDLTIVQLEKNIFQLKYWWLLLIISGIIGFISGNFELILKWLTIIPK